MDTKFKMISWNVKGLRSPSKRMRFLRHLKKTTHRHSDALRNASSFYRMQKLWVGKVIGASAQGRKAEVSILFHKNMTYDIHQVS